eukprot:PhF_6_TR31172/c0_g1_i1/m.45698
MQLGQIMSSRTRSMLIFIVFVLWIMAVFDTLIGAVLLEGYSHERLIRKADTVLISLLMPIGLWRAHKEVVLSGQTVSILFQVFALAVCCSTVLASPTRPSGQHAIILAVSGAALNLPYRSYQLITIIAALLIISYNCSFGIHGYPKLSIVSPEDDLVQDAFLHFRLVLIIPVLAAVVGSHSQGYYSLVESLENTLQTTKAISEFIAEYNTEGAETALNQFRRSEHCDKSVCEALATIVQNLKKYKPYLPNYVLPSSSSSSSSSSTRRSSGSNSNIVVEAEEEDNEDEQCSPLTPNHTPPTSPPLTPPSPSSSRSSSVKGSINSNRITSLQLLATIPERRDISYAMVDFRYVNDDVIDNPVPVRAFIDKVYQSAGATQAAVHSCIGDVIHLTWNAAFDVTAPKQRSTAFVRTLRARRTTPLSSRVDMCSCIMSGTAECRMTGTLHHAFLLHLGDYWGDAQAELLKYARLVHTNVVCKETAQGVQHIAVMMVDILELETHNKTLYVYELTTPQHEAQYASILKGCLAVDNDSVALSLLDSVISEASRLSGTEIPASVKHLHAKFQNKIVRL